MYRVLFSCIFWGILGACALSVQSCNLLDPPIYKPINYLINISVTGVPPQFRPTKPCIIRYVLDGREFQITIPPYTNGSHTIAIVEAPFDPKTEQLRYATRPNISLLTASFGDSSVYVADFQRRPENWQEWQYTQQTVNKASNSPAGTFTLHLNYTLFQYYFIIENRDTLRDYSLRYSSESFRDSLLVIPRGFSARVAHQIRIADFNINARLTQNPPQAFLNRYMRAQLQTPSRSIFLDSSRWSVENPSIGGNTVWYLRHRIYP
jgi:hypothetical protein